VMTHPLKPDHAFDWVAGQEDAVLAALERGVATLNGYSGRYPPGWTSVENCGDIGNNIRAARHFYTEHGLPAPEILPTRIITIGFGACDLVAALRPPMVAFGHEYRFGTSGEGNAIAGGGFWDAEPWGRWTVADTANLYLTFAAEPKRALALTFEGYGFSAARDRRQDIVVEVGGKICGVLTIATGKGRDRVVCPAGAMQAGENRLRLRILHPATPTETASWDDARPLGLGLSTLTVTPAD
jgi:hypothetical protein